jgi:hypothetical protein
VHDDFSGPNLAENPNEELKELLKDMTPLHKVFITDHDFVCISKQRNEELEDIY